VIGISLLTLVPGLSGGSETYARELCRALSSVGRLHYRVFVPTIAVDAAEGLPSTVVADYRASRSISGRIAAMSLAALRPAPLQRHLELDRLDAVHFPLSIMLPRVERPPAVTTIHDIQHETHPEFFSRAELTYRRVTYGWAVQRSRLVIAVSEHAREALIEHYGLAGDRVRAIHSGLDHEVFTPAEVPRDDFLLYPARPWRHKNHARLLEAFARLRATRPELRLVLTGEGNYGSLPSGVEALGRVSQERLVDLYRRAAALVFPSLYEGFALPVLEAMACGCAVACSNATALPEIAGDAARLFDPQDADDIAAGVEEVLADPEPWVARGFVRAGQFTWAASARAHEQVYRELSSG